MIVKFAMFLVVLAGLSPQINSEKILGIFHMCGRSHYLAGSSLMKILAERGHNVTIVAAFGEENPPKNYNQVILTGQYDKLMAFRPNFFEMTFNTFRRPIDFNRMSFGLIEDMFNHIEFKKFMNSNQTFDLVIVEEFQSEAVKYLAHHFNAPLVVYSSMNANEWTNPYQGNPDSPAYVPNVFHKFSCQMTFFERLHNTFYYVYSNLARVLITIPMHNRLVQKYFPGAPHLNDIIYNVSLALLNSDDSIHSPVPKVPSMVNVGGFHLKPPKALPEDLQIILDKAEGGIIFFSMGSTLKSSMMPPDKLNIFLRVLSRLGRTVLWKYEDENLHNKPSNVIIRKWFPQNDILAHKNVKLFITHGGLFSIMEAIYHGIPLLSLPVFAEQNMNSITAERDGYAKYIPFREITEDKLETYLHEVLTNPIYKENALKRSQIMKDKPMSPKEAVIYWVDYVIRNKGAPHLRVASLNLEWYQYLLLDVLLFTLVSLTMFVYLLKISIKLLFKSRKEKSRKNKTS